MKKLLLLFCLYASFASAQHIPRIVVMGSSTAAGTGPKNKDSAWVNLYSRYLGNKAAVFNLGVNGYTTYHILPDSTPPVAGRPAPDTAHNISKALALKPDILIINLPTNDIIDGFTLHEFRENLLWLNKIAREHHVTCYITTSQPRNTDTHKRNSLIQMRDTIKVDYPHHYIDFWTGTATKDGHILPQYSSGDGIHLNGMGHQLLFNRVKKRVKVP